MSHLAEATATFVTELSKLEGGEAKMIYKTASTYFYIQKLK